MNPSSTGQSLFEVARAELEAWSNNQAMPRGMVIIILFSFIHRYTTGQTVEQTFFKAQPRIEPVRRRGQKQTVEPDFEI